MIGLKSERELALMREAGGILAKVMEELGGKIEPGIKTLELDRIAEGLIKKLGVRPAFKDYKGYPASICVSVNETIVHGIPGPRVLNNGDIVSLDAGVELKGYFSDMARTYPVGDIDEESKKLIEAADIALQKAIEAAVAGNRVFDISHVIQTFVESRGFNVIRDFVGHGIGARLHEPPEIPNFGQPNIGEKLEGGMVLAIEPMISAGEYEVEILEDGWTAVTKDKSRVAHFEHTIAVTDGKPEVLTLCQRKNR